MTQNPNGAPVPPKQFTPGETPAFTPVQRTEGPIGRYKSPVGLDGTSLPSDPAFEDRIDATLEHLGFPKPGLDLPTAVHDATRRRRADKH